MPKTNTLLDELKGHSKNQEIAKEQVGLFFGLPEGVKPIFTMHSPRATEEGVKRVVERFGNLVNGEAGEQRRTTNQAIQHIE